MTATFACMVAVSSHAQANQGSITGIQKTGQPDDPTRCIAPAAQYHAVNPWILAAILKVESSFNPRAINRNANGTRDVGMGQINSIHLKELSKYGVAEQDLMDACKATYVSAWHLSKLYRKYGNTWFAIGAYNSATPCFNKRYAGLVWNALVDMNAVQGQKMRVKTLQQCGYPGKQTTKTPSHASTKQAKVTNPKTGGGTVIAFDAD